MTIREDIRWMGLVGWLAYMATRLLNILTFGAVTLYVLRYYLQPVPSTPIVRTTSGSRITVGVLSRDECKSGAFHRRPEAIAARFNHGAVCIAATNESGETMGFMWLEGETLPDPIVRCFMHVAPSSRVAWDYDFFIEPKYRLGRVFGLLWDNAATHLKSRGIEATVCWIRIENRASERAHMRLGARRIGWAAFLHVLGHEIMLSGFRPHFAYAPPGKHYDLWLDVTDQLSPIDSPAQEEGRRFVATSD